VIGTVVLCAVPVLTGTAIGYARRGRLLALAGRLRALWLLWLAVLIQAGQFYLDGVRRLIEERLGIPMLVLVFAAVLAWLAVNLRHWPRAARVAAAVVVAGAALNAAAIAASGRMPYSPRAAAAAGLPTSELTPKNVPGGDGTRLGFLGDVVPVAPLHKVVSAGDILIAVGAAALVAALMHARREVNRDE
jgi:uncharacterized protein DUF5317